MARSHRKPSRTNASRLDGVAGAASPPGLDSEAAEAILVNQLTVGSAVHLVKTEGGSLSVGGIAFRAFAVLLVAALVARAIALGHATVWHLFLPMVAEYLMLLLAHPVLALFVNDAELRGTVHRSLGWLAGMLVVGAIWIASRAFDLGTAWSVQAGVEFDRLREWVVGHGMLWPVVAAAAAMALSLPGRVLAFRRHGPPFLAVGTGCAMRFLVVLFGCLLLPFFTVDSGRVTWAIWALLLLSELGALAMHWDLQRRLAKRGIQV